MSKTQHLSQSQIRKVYKKVKQWLPSANPSVAVLGNAVFHFSNATHRNMGWVYCYYFEINVLSTCLIWGFV